MHYLALCFELCKPCSPPFLSSNVALPVCLAPRQHRASNTTVKQPLLDALITNSAKLQTLLVTGRVSSVAIVKVLYILTVDLVGSSLSTPDINKSGLEQVCIQCLFYLMNCIVPILAGRHCCDLRASLLWSEPLMSTKVQKMEEGRQIHECVYRLQIIARKITRISPSTSRFWHLGH
jgi:hypothetical protein